ncbi:MAG: ribose-phosphate pyrophosphokinase-like domain-containing protein [Betaproteobacteria bacterium]
MKPASASASESADAPLLFALAHTQALGNLVAQRLGLALTPHEERVFDDGEHKLRPLHSVRGRNRFVLHSLYGEPAQTVNGKLNRLLFFIDYIVCAGGTALYCTVCLVSQHKPSTTS